VSADSISPTLSGHLVLFHPLSEGGSIGVLALQLLPTLGAVHEVVLIVILHAMLVVCPAGPIFKYSLALREATLNSVVITVVTRHILL